MEIMTILTLIGLDGDNDNINFNWTTQLLENAVVFIVVPRIY